MYYIAIYRKGSSWQEGKSIFDHPIEEHIHFMKKLLNEGILIFGGPFEDNTGGVSIIQADDEDQAKKVLFEDPAVREKIIQIEELHPWYPAFFKGHADDE